MGGATFTPVQSTFHGRNDAYGINVDNGWFGALGSDWTQDTATPFRTRFVVQETGGKSANNQQFEVRYSYDGGAYTLVTATSTHCRLKATDQYTDNATTTQVIGSGTYVTGESAGGDEDGTTGNIDYAGNDEAEVEFSLYIPHDPAFSGKVLNLRVYLSGGTPLNSYTDTPAITIALLTGHPTALTTGNVIKGGNILVTSGGTYYGVFHDGSGGLKIWKDLFGTPASAGSAAASAIHGSGSIDWLSAAMDSNDDIQVVSSCNAVATRDVAFRIFDTGTDTWAGSWVEAAAFTAAPVDNQNHLAVDANNDAHIAFCDLQSGVDQVFYTNNISGWLTPERVNTSTGLNNSDPVIVCDPTTSTDVHVWYYADGNNDPAYRKRTSGSWGTITECDYVNYVNIMGMTITSGGTRYQYATAAAIGDTNLQIENILEGSNEGSGTDTTYNTPQTNEHDCVAAAFLDGTDRYIAYVDKATSEIYILSNTGSGWTDEGSEYPGLFSHLISYWASQNYNFTNEICFLFDDGASVYAGVFSTGSAAYTLEALQGSYSHTGQITDLQRGYVMPADQGSLAHTGQVTDLFYGVSMAADQGSYTLAGQVLDFLSGHVMPADQGSYALSGQVLDFLRAHVMPADQGAYTLAGQITALTFGAVDTSVGRWSFVGPVGRRPLIWLPQLISGEDIAGEYNLTADAGFHTLSGQVTNFLRGIVLPADQGSYVLAGQTIEFPRGYAIPLDQGAYTLSGQVTDLDFGFSMVADQGSYALAGQVLDFLRGLVMPADQGSYSLAGQLLDLFYGVTMPADQGSYTLAGQLLPLLRGIVLSADQGSYALSGQVLDFLRAHVMPADQGSYTLAGQVVDMRSGFNMTAAAGSYTLAGQLLGFLQALVLSADQGSYSLAGQGLSLPYGHTIPLDQGAYTLAGQITDLTTGFSMVADAGSYVLSGQLLNLLRDLILPADQGSYTLSGQLTGLDRSFTLDAIQGSYTLSGQDVALLVAFQMAANSGSYTLTGQQLALLYSAFSSMTFTAVLLANPNPSVIIFTNDSPSVDLDSNPSPSVEVYTP